MSKKASVKGKIECVICIRAHTAEALELELPFNCMFRSRIIPRPERGILTLGNYSTIIYAFFTTI
jgi:hypothetical protein